MPPDSTERLTGHMASSTRAPELNPDDVVFEAEQLQFAAITLHPGSDDFQGTLNYMKFLLARWHIVPFPVGQDG
jgi:hypothetical protein